MTSVSVGDVVLGRWRIVGRLGGGGMGDVWKIEALDSPITAALKTIKGVLNDEDRRRFIREAKVMADIQHPSVVGLHEVGVLDDGSPCIVMDLVDGESLQGRLERVHAFPVRVAVAMMQDVLAALGAAHARNIVHRDVKPANILVERAAPHRCRLADFGIARVFDNSMTRITATGIVSGTVDYMSPEHLQGHELSGKADIYSAGLVLWQALSGALPFHELNGVTRALRRCTTDVQAPQPPRGFPDIPITVVRTVLSMLARDPRQRPDATEAVSLLNEKRGATLLMPGMAWSAPTETHVAVVSPQAVAQDADVVGDGATLVVARLPPSRLAMPSERRWLAALAVPQSGYSIGGFWFCQVSALRAVTMANELFGRYGTAVQVTSEPLAERIQLTGAAAIGGGPLPAALTRAMELLSRP